MKQQKCRYCEQLFELKPGKPGFVDECPECLHAKTAPKPEALAHDYPPEAYARIREADRLIGVAAKSMVAARSKKGLPAKTLEECRSIILSDFSQGGFVK